MVDGDTDEQAPRVCCAVWGKLDRPLEKHRQKCPTKRARLRSGLTCHGYCLQPELVAVEDNEAGLRFHFLQLFWPFLKVFGHFSWPHLFDVPQVH